MNNNIYAQLSSKTSEVRDWQSDILNLEPSYSRMFKNLVLEKKGDKLLVWSNRSDVIQFFSKYAQTKDLNLTINLKDEKEVLSTAKYEASLEQPNFYVIPTNKWSSTFFKAFKQYCKREITKKDAETILEVNSFPAITIEMENEVRAKLLKDEWIFQCGVPGDFIYLSLIHI